MRFAQRSRSPRRNLGRDMHGAKAVPRVQPIVVRAVRAEAASEPPIPSPVDPTLTRRGMQNDLDTRRTHVAPAALRSLTAHSHLLPSWLRDAPPTTDPHRRSPSLAHRARRSRAFGWALPRAAKASTAGLHSTYHAGGSPKNRNRGVRGESGIWISLMIGYFWQGVIGAAILSNVPQRGQSEETCVRASSRER